MRLRAGTAEDRFIEAASRHGACTLQGDSRATNAAYRDLAVALGELRSGPDKGVGFLSHALLSGDLSVVSWSALHLLPHKEEEATAALERVARSGVRLISFSAEITLKEWRAKRLNID